MWGHWISVKVAKAASLFNLKSRYCELGMDLCPGILLAAENWGGTQQMDRVAKKWYSLYFSIFTEVTSLLEFSSVARTFAGTKFTEFAMALGVDTWCHCLTVQGQKPLGLHSTQIPAFPNSVVSAASTSMFASHCHDQSPTIIT